MSSRYFKTTGDYSYYIIIIIIITIIIITLFLVDEKKIQIYNDENMLT